MPMGNKAPLAYWKRWCHLFICANSGLINKKLEASLLDLNIAIMKYALQTGKEQKMTEVHMDDAFRGGGTLVTKLN